MFKQNNGQTPVEMWLKYCEKSKSHGGRHIEWMINVENTYVQSFASATENEK